ncbi:MAG TPA: aminopeptidase N [Rubrivivax sp.]|nr:aminopeptidase N [Rubrivivax sp.]
MREGPATLVRREDYAPPPFWIRSIELSFDLDPAKTIVGSRMRIERNPAAPPQALRLHGEGLTLLRVLADGESVSFREDGGLLVIDQPPAAESFTLEIRNTCAPEKNTELSGLYTSGGGFYTQCEAEGFRRITYFLDRPDVMAVYTVLLRADRKKYPVLLSNGNLIEQGELDHGRHFAKWQDPFPKPSYLFALVAADLVAREQKIRTRGGKEHLLQVYVKRADLGKTEHAMNSLVAAVAWDEARFGLALDLERFMIVAVDDFNFGAMENKGLNLFNTKYVLASADSATDNDFFGIESVVAHEYFHNWTGNRVTCRDWFQLSLKEGLTVFRDQEFSMDMAGGAGTGAPPAVSTRAVQRIEDVLQLRTLQFPEDAGSMAHPVRPEAYAAINNFYTPTVYEKGAEVVRMMHTLVGRDGFAKGLKLYFERHDGQAVTCDDFAQAVADANPGSPLAQQLDSFKQWYARAGTPRLTARGHYDAEAQRYTLKLSQALAAPAAAGRGQDEGAPLLIPVEMALIGRDGRPLPLRLAGETAPQGTQRLLVLDQPQREFSFVGVPAEPVPSLLRGFSAPVVLDDGLDDAALLTLLAHDSDPFNRWEAGQRLSLRRLLAALHGDALPLPDETYVQALRGVLREPSLDPAFKAMVLALPGEGYVAEQLARADPQRIHAVREQLLDHLAEQLHADWAWAWEQHQVRGGYAPARAQAGQRSLAARALAMLCRHAARSGNPVWPGRAYQQVKDAGNMSERLAALNALLHARAPLAEPALAHFHAAAHGNALVLDKWFDAQARASEDPSTGAGAGAVLVRAKALLQHPDFSLRNPNRVRSLLVALCRDNPAAFHRADGSGYVFWAERLLELDAINPSVAGRLARAMDRWSHLAEPYRSGAREAVARVAARSELSAELREIVNRALEST